MFSKYNENAINEKWKKPVQNSICKKKLSPGSNWASYMKSDIFWQQKRQNVGKLNLLKRVLASRVWVILQASNRCVVKYRSYSNRLYIAMVNKVMSTGNVLLLHIPVCLYADLQDTNTAHIYSEGSQTHGFR